jgi:hypothetical protein
MSELVNRRMRLLRLRTIEHRLAVARSVNADVALANLADVAMRITNLRAQLTVGDGASSGLALKAMCEMSHRLDTARTGLARPIADAERVVDEMREGRLRARSREESAVKLHASAESREILERETRADANRPFVRRNQSIGGAQ